MGSDRPEDVSTLVKSNDVSLLASHDNISSNQNSASMASASASDSTESPGSGSHPTKPVVQQSDMELISVPPSGPTVHLGPHAQEGRQASEVDKGGQPPLPDGSLGLEDSQEGEEWSEAEHESKRVKVYELVGSRWVDQGTAFCFGQLQEETNEAFLVARAESNFNNIILSTPIRTNDVYQQQAETLIVWTEPDGVDYALSFQEPEGCLEVWNFIQDVQQHLRGADAELTLTSSSPPNVPEPSVTATSIIRSGHLPTPQLGIIPEIERAIKALARTGPVKERICEYIQNEEYVKSMVELFNTAEDLESLENLHALCSLMQTILMLNDHSMYEHILDDELFFGVIGMLEYDPEFPNHKANYRAFLHQSTNFHHPIQIRDPNIQRKVHHTYRLQFMKDVVLARALDDSTFNVLSSCIIFNQIDIITHVQLEPTFLRDVVRLYVDEDVLGGGGRRVGQEGEGGMDMDPNPDEQGEGPVLNGAHHRTSRVGSYAFAPPENLSEEDIALRKDVVLLIQHLCAMGKNAQLATRLALFRTLVDRGILFAVQWAFELPEREEGSKVMISNAGEILAALLDHDVIGVRGHVLKQVVAIEKERLARKRGADKAETILVLMCRMMASSRDLAVQSQIGDAFKALLEVPQEDGFNVHAPNGVKFLARGGKDEPGTEKFLDYFYKSCMDILFKPLNDVPEVKNFADPVFTLTREKTNLYTYLCDLLCNFALQHSFRSHFYILSSNVATRVATLLRTKDKHLRLASFRLYRTFLKLNNRNLFAHLMKHDLLKPILDLTLLESRRDNLLSSSCQEFFDHMRRENFKDLIKHCMTKHEPIIRKLAETPLGRPRFESFINRWEMNNEPLPPEEPKAEKPVEIRTWPVQARHMEAEEEDYFNTDDDDDDHNIPSISAPLNRGQSPMPANALKRKRRVAISGQQRMYRPLNVSNTLRTPSPPPLGSLVDYDEDGEDPSGLKPVEGDSALSQQNVSPPMRTIEIPSGPKLTHQQLPPSPRRPVFDDDEDNALEALARPKAPSPSGTGPPPTSMAPLRPSEKRRRNEEEEDNFGRLERLRKAKKVDPAASNLAGRGSSPKAPEEPPKKLRLKFGSPMTLESSSSTTRTQSGAKDGENG